MGQTSRVTGFLPRKLEKRARRQCASGGLQQVRIEVRRDVEIVLTPDQPTDRLMPVQGVAV